MNIWNVGTLPVATAYPTRSDPCRTFEQDMRSLYLLALLLTAEQHAAERCFASSPGDGMDLRYALEEWNDSWTRRVVLQNAIRMLEPAMNNEEEIAPSYCASAIRELNPVLHAVLQLNTFDRFVFVMSVLEGYSDHDCLRLLRCSKRDVVAARAKALEHLVATYGQELSRHPQGEAPLHIEIQLPKIQIRVCAGRLILPTKL